LKFKLDENLPELVRVALSKLGFDAHTAAEEGLAGAPDQSVLEACTAEQLTVINFLLAWRAGARPACGVADVMPPRLQQRRLRR